MLEKLKALFTRITDWLAARGWTKPAHMAVWAALALAVALLAVPHRVPSLPGLLMKELAMLALAYIVCRWKWPAEERSSKQTENALRIAAWRRDAFIFGCAILAAAVHV